MKKWLAALGRGPFGPGLLIAFLATFVAIRFAPRVDDAWRGPSEFVAGPSGLSEAIGRSDGTSTHRRSVADELIAQSHVDHDETIVVLAGDGRFLVGDRAEEVRSGLVLSIPRGTVYSLEVTGEPVEMISVFSPPFVE